MIAANNSERGKKNIRVIHKSIKVLNFDTSERRSKDQKLKFSEQYNKDMSQGSV